MVTSRWRVVDVDGETVTRHVTPELAYRVKVERSQAKVGGQDAVTPINLRATMIMAHEDGVGRLCIGTQTRSRPLGQPNQSFSSSLCAVRVRVRLRAY
jgi:hypothetical protein